MARDDIEHELVNGCKGSYWQRQNGISVPIFFVEVSKYTPAAALDSRAVLISNSGTIPDEIHTGDIITGANGKAYIVFPLWSDEVVARWSWEYSGHKLVYCKSLDL